MFLICKYILCWYYRFFNHAFDNLAFQVLDACMKRCGINFHMEVGKFRFLNELIKLVSPKYNGAHTPETVKRRVLELMQSWTVYYPKEFKIKEAYEMLKKQGVVKVSKTLIMVKW